MRRPWMMLGMTAYVCMPYLAVRAVFWLGLAPLPALETGTPFLRAVAETATFAAVHRSALLFGLLILLVALPYALQGVLTPRVVHALRPTPAGGHGSVRRGLKRVLSVLGMALLPSLKFGGMYLIVLWAEAHASGGGEFNRFLVLLAGFVALQLLPTTTRLRVCVLVVEERGLRGARRREAALRTFLPRGLWNRVRHRALVTLPTLVGWGMAWAAIYLFGPRPGVPERPLALFLVGGAVTVCFAAFAAVANAVAYAELREAEERWEAKRAAAVFE